MNIGTPINTQLISLKLRDLGNLKSFSRFGFFSMDANFLLIQYYLLIIFMLILNKNSYLKVYFIIVIVSKL